MQLIEKYRPHLSRFAGILIWAIILVGIILRLVLFFQNRNLIIDEANIVRNLYERNFLELILPLKYEQYAPPIFLWIEELLSLIFGYGEKALRLYPLLSGIALMFLFRATMRRLGVGSSLWLPMALMAFTYLLIKYSVELKQYIPDAMIALLLVWLALKKGIDSAQSKVKFILFWAIAGSLAIWSSMPSVFTLAAIGFYFLLQVFTTDRREYFVPLILVGGIWLLQFGIYYWFILKPQVESDYLQGYHFEYFLYATPDNMDQWKHNYYRIKEIINNIGGYNPTSYYITSFFILLGVVSMIIRRNRAVVLVSLPILFTLIAAALNQYTLIDRVILFILPLGLILFGVGFNEVWRIKFVVVKLLLIWMGVFMIQNFNMFWLFERKLGFHEITAGFEYIKEKGGEGSQVYVHHASTPTYIYYTEMHPDREQYSMLTGAHKLTWDTDYNQLTSSIRDTAYFLYTGGFPDHERDRLTSTIEKNMVQVDYFRPEEWIVFVYTYAPKVNTPDSLQVR